MQDINLVFSRTLLANVMEDIRKVTSPAERKAAWVYHFGGDSWEFHGPEGANGRPFYWYGRADNAYDARAKGWEAWWTSLEQDGAAYRARQEGERLRAAGVGRRVRAA